MSAQRFVATLEQYGSGTVVVVPFDLKEAFGSGRPPVRATVNGDAFRTTLFTMGGALSWGSAVRCARPPRSNPARRSPSNSSATTSHAPSRCQRSGGRAGRRPSGR
jgi:hypothetical protein